jgi:rSAM/selenodomain-associated transferase 2
VSLSVIIPTFNEAHTVQRAIDSAWSIDANEVIVVDGGSCDQTVQIAQASQAKVIFSVRGRGTQLNQGAKIASGRILMFLHADNAVSVDCGKQLRAEFQNPRIQFVCFYQRIENLSRIYRWIERGNWFRARYRQLPYGDQALTVTREAYDRVGGFDEIPLMEDVRFSRNLAREFPPEVLPGPLLVDDRRWRERGPVRQTLRNWWTLLRFQCGATPERLAEFYHRGDSLPPGSDSQ